MDIKAAIKEALHEFRQGQDNNVDTTLKAQIDKLTADNVALKAENDAFKTEQEAQKATGLKTARENAIKAAVAAHGQDGKDLPALKAQIEGMADTGLLATLTSTLELASKNVENRTRQTSANDPATEPDDARLSRLEQAKKDGEKANQPKGGGR